MRAYVDVVNNKKDTDSEQKLETALNDFDNATHIPRLEQNQAWIAAKDTVRSSLKTALITAGLTTALMILVALQPHVVLALSVYLCAIGYTTGGVTAAVATGTLLYGLFRTRPSIEGEKVEVMSEARKACGNNK